MHFDVKKAFRQAAAVIVLGLMGAGAGGFGYQHLHGKPDAPATPAQTAVAAAYTVRLDAIADAQHKLGSTTDEESAGRLYNKKVEFRIDALLDTALSDKAAGELGAHFNKFSRDDGLTFSAIAKNPASAAQRSECLADVALTPDRKETAERVEDCMLVYAEKGAEHDKQQQKTATEIGGLFGIALAGSFLLGRKSAKPSI